MSDPPVPTGSAKALVPVPPTHAARLTVVIVEDERDVREGLAILIDGAPGFQCTSCYRTMEQALADLDTDHPDVLLTDLALPGMSGIEGIAALRKTHPNLPILALTIFDTDDRNKLVKAALEG